MSKGFLSRILETIYGGEQEGERAGVTADKVVVLSQKYRMNKRLDMLNEGLQRTRDKFPDSLYISHIFTDKALIIKLFVNGKKQGDGFMLDTHKLSELV